MLTESLRVEPAILTELAREAFRRSSFYLRKGQLDGIAAVLNAKTASDNDRFVAESLLRNAVTASRGTFPLCQDTGTCDDSRLGRTKLSAPELMTAAALSEGAKQAYETFNLRSSQVGGREFLQ